MIKAVFFDWFNTLAAYNPPREEIYRKAFLRHGIDLSLKTIYLGLQAGDACFLADRGKDILTNRSFQDQAAYFIFYPQKILANAGLHASDEILLQVVQEALRSFGNTYTLFEDVLPLFQKLKTKQFLLGIITNADKYVLNYIESLGLKPFLDVIMTSEQAGAEKPSPRIFSAALEAAAIQPSEMLYVGDQYKTDILGARSAGCQAVLLDRYGINSDIQDCPKISSLTDLPQYL